MARGSRYLPIRMQGGTNEMTRNEFLQALRHRLAGMPKADLEDRISFYNEMIDDRIDEGLSEAEAIAALGSVDSVIAQVIASVPLRHLVREKISTTRKPSGMGIALIALGSPLWLALAISAFAVVLSLFVTLWAVVACLWVSDIALAASLLGGVGLGAVLLFTSSASMAVAMIGVGLVGGGLSILFFFGAKYATIGAAKLTRLSAIGIKKLFI